jgi:hypothetical protein
LATGGFADDEARDAGLGDVTALGDVASATGRARVNHHKPPLATTVSAATVRTIADGAERDTGGSPLIKGDGVPS